MQMTDNAQWAKPPKDSAPPFPPCGPPVTQGRAGLSAVSFKGKLWVLGGSQGDDLSIGGGPNCRQVFNDVWYSSDGIEWHEATAGIDKDDPDVIWRPRAGAVVVVKGGWMYIIGGEQAFLQFVVDR